MPVPGTQQELLQLVTKSGLLAADRLDEFVRTHRESLPADPGDLAQLLVTEGLLTNFQAGQLIQGKWRGFMIGKYKVLERLGHGGMGQVYLCEHARMRRRVAVKVLPTDHAEDPANLERFFREARAAASLDHPNIVRAFDLDQDGKVHFLVMEFVNGPSLFDLVKKNGPMEMSRACHYVREAAVALQHAHEAGLIHRDIKPSNIMVDRSGAVKLLDLGLARFYADNVDTITQRYDANNVLGTADYVAPEQTRDSHAVDTRADIYALGCTFYYLLAARPPFPEGTPTQKLIWHQSRTPRRLPTIRPDLPSGVVAIVETMMAKRPDQRFQTPGELVQALEPWTRTPVAPPADAELPVLSPAAAEAGTPVPGKKANPPVKPKSVYDLLVSPSSPAQSPVFNLRAPPPVPAEPTPTERPRPAAEPLPAFPFSGLFVRRKPRWRTAALVAAGLALGAAAGLAVTVLRSPVRRFGAAGPAVSGSIMPVPAQQPRSFAILHLDGRDRGC